LAKNSCSTVWAFPHFGIDMKPQLLHISCPVLASSDSALTITGKWTVVEMRPNVREDPPLFMHSRPTVIRTVVIDRNSTLETVVARRRKSGEPSMEQGFGLIMVGLTSTLEPVPVVRVLPETWWKKCDTEHMFNVMRCLLPCLLVVGTKRRECDSVKARGCDLSTVRHLVLVRLPATATSSAMGLPVYFLPPL